LIVCPHRPPCQGCPRLDAPGIDPGARAALQVLAEENGLPPPRIVEGKPTQFRHRARLAIRGRMTAPKIGIFERDSHRVVDIPRCLVHHPLINEVAAEIRRAMVTTRTPPYSDTSLRGVVRYAQVVVERRSQTAQVVIVTNGTTPRDATALMSRLSDRLGPRLHSLHWNGNPARTNTILGPHWERLVGPEAVEEQVGGARVFYPPGAFGQSHLDLADALVATVQGWVPEGANVAELYSGVGPVGLGLVPRAKELVFNEVAADSLRGLELGVEALAPEMRSRVRVVPGRAAAASHLAASSDVVIVDPPRKGLDAPLRDALVASPPGRLVYVACGLPSFLDDTAALLASARWRLSELVVFDLFPHTEHVEVVARFDSRGS
jgi:tRNA/tmRNA/rRNA uracil-C5-methylase (TrmA/RlmC/RlmD family)